MQTASICLEKYEDTIIAWCDPITDEKFLLSNVQLEDTEKARLHEMTATTRRCEWLTTRWLLQQVLSKDTKIIYNANGKPVLSNKLYSVSISHCRELIAIIINKSNKAIGIDCETITDRIFKIKHKFAQQELPEITKHELENLTLVWSAKEALYKLYSHGGLEFNEHLRINNFEFSTEGGTFTGTISKETICHYNIHFKHIRNSLLVWVSE